MTLVRYVWIDEFYSCIGTKNEIKVQLKLNYGNLRKMENIHLIFLVSNFPSPVSGPAKKKKYVKYWKKICQKMGPVMNLTMAHDEISSKKSKYRKNR